MKNPTKRPSNRVGPSISAGVGTSCGGKGEESGNVQEVKAVYLDCDEDTILLKVNQIGGAACHVGYKSCFYRRVTPDGLEIEGERVFDPKDVYKK